MHDLVRRRGWAVLSLGVVGALALSASACGSSNAAPVPPPVVTGRVDAAGVTWLCRPGLISDPCAGNLTTTSIGPDGARTVVHLHPATDPPIDCFYVYPTVSTQTTGNATLAAQPAETSVAAAQASPFSQQCRVYAPMYRQATLASLTGQATTPVNVSEAYSDVLAAWHDYLARYNDGRGFVLIGHSQGAFVLERLIAQTVEGNPSVRRRLVSAILLGGNVTVRDGKSQGGSFSTIPACRSANQTGCVIAYSTFAAGSPPPANSIFGRTSSPGEHVLCTNPAALAGGTGSLETEVPTDLTGLSGVVGAGLSPLVPKVATPWISWPNRFDATCTAKGGATFLSASATVPSGRPMLDELSRVLPPTWGLHLVDVNIAVGNLVSDVAAESSHFVRATGR
ncbi:MAG: DUF3089 domain-containing protein [Acidimicrobiales bacterium]